MTNTMNASKIKQALTLLHHYERAETRVSAARRAATMADLTEAEANVLARAVNLTEAETTSLVSQAIAAG